jgi:hypothetical protein
MFSIVPADLSAAAPEAEPAVTEEVKAVAPVPVAEVAPVVKEAVKKIVSRGRAKAKSKQPEVKEVNSVLLLCISEATHKPGVNNVGDIVGVFTGDWQFSDAEKKGFTIIKVDGITRTQMMDSLPQLETGMDEKKNAEYWKDGDTWRELKRKPKYLHTLKGLDPVDRMDLSSKRAAYRNAAIAKIKLGVEAIAEK